MFDAISPSEPRSGTLADGRAEISFVRDGPKTRLDHLYNRDPLRFLFPNSPDGECMQTALVTTSGGLVGGDRLSIHAAAGRGARAQISPQAAEKIYRSIGPDCTIDVALQADAESWLEWLPQETILFEAARLKRATRIECDGDARVLAGEILVFGRIGRGERMATGFVGENWDVYRDGRLIWADALRLDGDVAGILDHPAGLGGATAAATVVYTASDAPARLDDARACLAETDGVRAAATIVNGVLVARFLSADARALRGAFGRFWSGFRARAAGLPAALPRLWHV